VTRIGQRNTGKGVNLYSLEKERALGQKMAETIDRQTKFVTDPNIVKYVSGVAQRIIRNSDAQVAFTIKVVDSTELNTFALPGGFLYVDKGLLSELDSEAELAGLIAHEVAHVAARHGTRYETRRTAWNLISFPAIYMAGPGAIGARQIGPLALRKFARDAELEADLLGMEYQYAAGYDPRAFIDALEGLHNKQIPAGKHEGSFGRPLHQIAKSYAFYPPMEERIVRLQSEISSLLPCRDTYVTDTSEFQEIKGRLLADEVVLRRDHAGHGEGENGGPILRRHPTEWQRPMLIHTALLSNAKSFSF
jgi:Zn-dependent protease with chaperone function